MLKEIKYDPPTDMQYDINGKRIYYHCTDFKYCIYIIGTIEVNDDNKNMMP